ERGAPVASRSLTSSTSLRPAGAPLRNPSAAQALHVSDDVTGAIGQLGVELRDLLDRRLLVDGVLEVGHRHAEELEQPARLVAGHAPSFVRTGGARRAGFSCSLASGRGAPAPTALRLALRPARVARLLLQSYGRRATGGAQPARVARLLLQSRASSAPSRQRGPPAGLEV